MERLIITYLLCFSFISSYATLQIPDKIIYEGDTVYLSGFPLEQYFDSSSRPNFAKLTDCFSTGCYRGYKSLWEIKDGKLVLNTIYTCCESTDLLIREKDVKALGKELPKKVFSLITPYINKRIDSKGLYEILNAASAQKRWVRKYGYRYINDIENNCQQITVEHEISKKEVFLIDENVIYATWFTGELSFDYGKVINEAKYSYFPEREYTVRLKFLNGVIIDKEISKNYSP